MTDATNKPIELMNLYWSASGLFPGQGEISPFDFKDRAEAAAKAGFSGMGIWHTDLEHILIHRSLPEMKMIMDDNGIKHLELEFLTDWFVEGARRGESDSRKRRLLNASAALNAHHVKIGDFYSTPAPMSQIVDSFASLCKEAEGYGATIAFEFMGSAMLRDIKSSLAMVEGAGAQNGGIIVDIVHVVSQGIPYEEVSRIPAEYLINVELNDGALPGSILYDPARARRFCGEGDWDIKGFIQCVQGTGYTGPWAVEVFSDELVGIPMAELYQRSYETTMAQFADL